MDTKKAETKKQTPAKKDAKAKNETPVKAPSKSIATKKDLIGVEEVDALVLGGLAAEGEALGGCGKGGLDALAQIPAEDGGFGGGVVDVLAGLGADLNDLALLDDHHALTVRNGDHRTV